MKMNFNRLRRYLEITGRGECPSPDEVAIGTFKLVRNPNGSGYRYSVYQGECNHMDTDEFEEALTKFIEMLYIYGGHFTRMHMEVNDTLKFLDHVLKLERIIGETMLAAEGKPMSDEWCDLAKTVYSLGS